MLFMNEYEIAESAARYAEHPTLGPATRTLLALCNAVNDCSDGWPYWRKPARAAAKLMTFIQGADPMARFDMERADATPAKLRAALSPVKAFRTREGIEFPIYECEV